MNARKTGFLWLFLFCVLVLIPIALVAAPSAHQRKSKSQTTLEREPMIASLKGPDLFRAYCAPCHGVDGKGHGPVASTLKTRVPDLTAIARRNGGRFPAARIRSIILGDKVMTAHGSREMPIWGPIFHQIERDRDFGNIRIENITRYLESIQKQ